MSTAFEVNFDGIVGPTHNYAGLSHGNIASLKHRGAVSRPREAALQGLAKMKFLHGLGVRQAVLPPHPRPDLAALRRLGFGGSDADVLWNASRQNPRLLAAVYSSSAMWAANAATVSPSADSEDGCIHFTPANLLTQFHRSIESAVTSVTLRAIFPEGEAFAHHDALPAADAFADEGAANHMRLCRRHGGRGVQVFIYGRAAESREQTASNFPARQTLEASAAIARRHGLGAERIVLARQNVNAINAGAFHNDVVAVSNENVLLMHASALAEQNEAMDEIRRKFAAVCGGELVCLMADPSELSLTDAVETYLFNSQLVTLPDGTMAMIAPIECREHPRAAAFLQRICDESNPVAAVHYLDVRQSMRNGGGPACLRLRVVLSEQELQHVRPGVLIDDALNDRLIAWVQRHYRQTLEPGELADPALMRECLTALDELTNILMLGPIYDFQR